MKKFITIFALAVSFFTITGFVGNNILAATCGLGAQGFNASTGDLQFCVGGFPDKQSLKSFSVKVNCVKESGSLACGTATQSQSVSLSSVPDAQIAQAADGFYTCGTVTMNPKVEQVSLNVTDSSGASVCNFTGNTGIGNQAINVTPTKGIDITCGSDGLSVNTAIGCIPFGNQNELVGFFLKWGLGIGGGIAFLLLLIGGFQIMTSRGDPNKLKAGQELLTSAIAGLLLLVFSLVILRIIGVDILKVFPAGS
ncbi:MAG TPA: hypothetical protein VLE44_01895 [Candidatus Saccharimonadales bacterium]|nr:hypothetical protein [Candidatus Saccharimonadales bacterium]